MDRNLLTAHELAQQLNLSVETIWRYTREDKVPFITLGHRQYRYNLNQVITALGTIREKSAEYQKKAAFNEFSQMPDEPGCSIELMDGVVKKEPSPGVKHQVASFRLQRILADYFEGGDPRGVVFGAPMAVTFSEVDLLIPDLFYVPGNNRGIIEEDRVNGTPELVVEILSPSSYRRDRIEKMEIYRKAGILQYWLLDPNQRTLEVFVLKEGDYARIAAGCDEETVTIPDLPGLSIDLGKLWFVIGK